MKPILIIFSVLSVLCTGIEATNFFKFLLCGGRDNNFKIVPVGHDDTEKVVVNGTPGSTPDNSDRLSNEEVAITKQQQEEEVQHQQQQVQQRLDAPLKPKIVKKPKNVHFWEPEEYRDFLNGLSIKPAIIKPEPEKEPEVLLGTYASKIRDLFRTTKGRRINTRINFSDLSEESSRELLKIKRHLKIVWDPDERADFLLLLPNVIEYSPDYSLTKVTNLYDVLDDHLKEVESMRDFLKIVHKFYSIVGAKDIVKDCTKAILRSGLFTTDELPEVFNMTFDQIFQFACVYGFDSLATELVNTKTVKELKLYRGVYIAFKANNKDLGHRLLDIIGNKYGKHCGSIYDRLCDHLNLYELAEEKEGEES